MHSSRIEVFFTEHVVQLHAVDLRTRRRAIGRCAGDEVPVAICHRDARRPARNLRRGIGEAASTVACGGISQRHRDSPPVDDRLRGHLAQCLEHDGTTEGRRRVRPDGSTLTHHRQRLAQSRRVGVQVIGGDESAITRHGSEQWGSEDVRGHGGTGTHRLEQIGIAGIAERFTAHRRCVQSGTIGRDRENIGDQPQEVQLNGIQDDPLTS